MTTTQVAPNGHRASPPPCSVENSAELNSADLPANQDNIIDDATSIVIPSDEPERGIPPYLSSPADHEQGAFPASAYHVPPSAFTPSPNPYQRFQHSERPNLGPMPDRCQFMFSDGRQCTMARSDIHPSLCFYHADREEQLFGDPSYRCETRKLDFPELYSACRDLSTAAGVNRALAQVFRLLAQRRISRQEAATFAKLGHLLLQSIRAAQAESLENQINATDPVVRSEYTERGAQLGSRSTLRETPPELSHRAGSSLKSQISDLRSPDGAPRSAASHAPVQASAAPITASPQPPAPRMAMSNSRKINTSAVAPGNSPEISTYDNVELQPIQNQHLHKRHTEQEIVIARSHPKL